MNEVFLCLPFPPSVNHYWRHVGSKVLISRKGRAYRHEVFLQRQQQIPHGGLLLATGELGMVLEVLPPDRRRRDLDNLLKALLDSLVSAKVFADDSQIVDLRIVKRPTIVAGGEVRATVYLKE